MGKGDRNKRNRSLKVQEIPEQNSSYGFFTRISRVVRNVLSSDETFSYIQKGDYKYEL